MLIFYESKKKSKITRKFYDFYIKLPYKVENKIEVLFKIEYNVYIAGINVIYPRKTEMDVKMILYKCIKDNIETKSSICPVCNSRTEKIKSDIYWCQECRIPLFEDTCAICGGKAKRLTSDVRPVFPEERLLLEIIEGRPFAYRKDSVWNGTGNRYYVNGKRIPFKVADLRHLDADKIRARYRELEGQNDESCFREMITRFLRANVNRLQAITSEGIEYVQSVTDGCSTGDMFVSFSGGKDSTVTSSLVMRALGTSKILHIFGDTTLEFPFTEEYVERFKKQHPGTPVISSRNKEKNFEELCQIIGPPSRVMRWCCTIFKTGAIQRKIKTLFRDKKKIITFYGIRRSESVSRSKYERESASPKITKQVTISPIIDWLDFDVWLYMLSNQLDFNEAYRLGYARVGCWCCPNNTGWSEFLSRIYMPEQSKRFHDMLITFAESIGKKDAEVYVDEGYWKARQGGNGVKYAGKSVISFAPCALEENTFNFALQRPISQELYELFKPFGYLQFDLGNTRLGEVYITNKKGELLLKMQGRIGASELKVTILNYPIAGAGNLKLAEDKIKCQITKYQMCMGCLACESVCRHNAIVIREDSDRRIKYYIDDTKCVRCGECVGHFDGGCYMRKVLCIKRMENMKD